MKGEIQGSGTLVVKSNIRLDKSSFAWNGALVVNAGSVDPRATMAFGTSSVRIEPDDGKSPSLELGLYGATGAYTNEFKQVWDVADGATEEDYSTAAASISVADNTKAGGHIYWQGNMDFTGSAVMRVGSDATYCGNQYNLYLNGDVTLPDDTATLYLRTWGNYYFNGNSLTAWRIYAGSAWSQCYTVYLDTPNLNVRQIVLYSSNFKLMENCSETLPQLHWAWSWDAARYKVDLNGRSFKTPGLSFTERVGALKRFFSLNSSDSCSITTGGPSVGNSVAGEDVWLTLTGGQHYRQGYTEALETNYMALVRFIDNVSLRMDAYTNTCVQTLRLLPSTTKGALDVNCGKLRIEAPASFKNLTSIRVGQDGVLDTVLTNCPGAFEAYGITSVTNFVPYGGYVENIYQSVTNLEVDGRFLMTNLEEADPLPSVKVLSLGKGARLEMTPGYTFRVNRYVYNGIEQAPGVYTPSELVRGGIVLVDDGAASTVIKWQGTNGNDSVQYGWNWEGYARDVPELSTGHMKPYFSAAGTNVVFDTAVLFDGMTFISPTGIKPGVTLAKEKGVGGRAARIGLMEGGIVANDGTSTTASKRRTHVIEPPVYAYASQEWNLAASDTVIMRNGFSDAGVQGVRINRTGKGILILNGTNVISEGSSFVTLGGSSNVGWLGVTGELHVAGAVAISNGTIGVHGRIAGHKGATVRQTPVPNAEGTLTYRQYSSSGSSDNYKFWLNEASLDLPVWLEANNAAFYLMNGTENYVHAPLVVRAQKANNMVTLYKNDGTLTLEDQIVASNCCFRSQYTGHLILRNKYTSENGGNRFYVLYATSGLLEFDCPYNTFRDPDYGGVTLDSNTGRVQFDVDLAVTNGTLRFHNLTEKDIYTSFCDLGITSQRIDRIVGKRSASTKLYPNGRSNPAVLCGAGAWLEIAGNGAASTNGIVISNCVNVVKTGSADLLYYDHDFTHSGELVVCNGKVTFATNATWQTAQDITVVGPGVLALEASERFARRVRLHLDNVYEEVEEPADESAPAEPPAVLAAWQLNLPEGVTQSVTSVLMDGKLAASGVWGNTNFNMRVTHHSDQIQGAGVLKIAAKSLILRFR